MESLVADLGHQPAEEVGKSQHSLGLRLPICEMGVGVVDSGCYCKPQAGPAGRVRATPTLGLLPA